MKKNLVIVESPGKIKTISKILGRDFEVKASVGHIMNLPKNDLGVEVDNDFKAVYKVIYGKAKVIEDLKKACEGKENIYLAPDPDREGEAISWNLASVLNIDLKRKCRVTFNAITEKVVRDALKNPQKIDMEKVNAQQARRILDRLVGYKLSPLLWDKVSRGLSAGRVQSVAVYLVFKREQEIESFITEEYWTIDTTLEASSKEQFGARLEKHKGKKIKIENAEQAADIESALKKAAFIIEGIEKKKKDKLSPLPYITSTLQQEASRRYGYSARDTMKIAQQLYEGIDLKEDGGVTGLITYMRTDSTRITEEAVVQAKDYIKAAYGDKYIGFQRKAKGKKNVQDAHEAIRPTAVDMQPASIKKYLNAKQYKIYELIYNRFLASQMAPAVYDTVTLDIQAGDYQLKSRGSILVFDGFLKIYNDEENQSEKDTMLPDVKKGEECSLESIDKKQHFTEPPPRYTEATLIKDLEKEGIGRPSTYAVIMEIILERNYVDRRQKKLYITDLGIVISKLLLKYFDNIMNIKFTAQLENELDAIETSRVDHVTVLREFYKSFLEDLGTAESDMKKTTFPTDITCEKCGKNYVFMFGSNGKFLACQGYPRCRNTINLDSGKNYLKTDYDLSSELALAEVIAQEAKDEKKPETIEEKCPQCSADLVLRTGRFGEFIACSRYPSCKYTKRVEKTIGIKCPKAGCAGDIVVKKTRKNRIFYGCSEYPKCDFVSWDKPTGNLCPQCSKFTVLKETKKIRQEVCSGKKDKSCSFSRDIE